MEPIYVLSLFLHLSEIQRFSNMTTERGVQCYVFSKSFLSPLTWMSHGSSTFCYCSSSVRSYGYWASAEPQQQQWHQQQHPNVSHHFLLIRFKLVLEFFGTFHFSSDAVSGSCIRTFLVGHTFPCAHPRGLEHIESTASEQCLLTHAASTILQLCGEREKHICCYSTCPTHIHTNARTHRKVSEAWLTFRWSALLSNLQSDEDNCFHYSTLAYGHQPRSSNSMWLKIAQLVAVCAETKSNMNMT